MADYLINVFLDDEKGKKIEEAGLAGTIVAVDGKKAIQVDYERQGEEKTGQRFPGPGL